MIDGYVREQVGLTSARQGHTKEEAMYVPCTTHNMNLAFQDAVSKVNIWRDAMRTVKELINTIRESLKTRGLILSVSLQAGTVCGRSVKSVLA